MVSTIAMSQSNQSRLYLRSQLRHSQSAVPFATLVQRCNLLSGHLLFYIEGLGQTMVCHSI